MCQAPQMEAALAMMISIQGRYFAWTGSKGDVSIWDLEMGQHISYIPVEDDSNGVHANISKDGSKVANSVKGLISIHQTMSGVKLGDYPLYLGGENYFQVVLDEDQFMLHKDYKVQYLLRSNDPFLAYAQGSVVNILRHNLPDSTLEGTCTVKESVFINVQIDPYVHENVSKYTSHSGATFTASTRQLLVLGNWLAVLTVTFTGAGTTKSMTIPLGLSSIPYDGVFLAGSSRLVLVLGRYFQVWRLSGTAEDVAELELTWRFLEMTTTWRQTFTAEILSAQLPTSKHRKLSLSFHHPGGPDD
ncbi:hypothetical protein BGX28_006262 [Mortierella sp. GBA30]|nr:hypothetical protein BGX28_006262 [Mortierella sp. GBA30]